MWSRLLQVSQRCAFQVSSHALVALGCLSSSSVHVHQRSAQQHCRVPVPQPELADSWQHEPVKSPDAAGGGRDGAGGARRCLAPPAVHVPDCGACRHQGHHPRAHRRQRGARGRHTSNTIIPCYWTSSCSLQMSVMCTVRLIVTLRPSVKRCSVQIKSRHVQHMLCSMAHVNVGYN